MHSYLQQLHERKILAEAMQIRSFDFIDMPSRFGSSLSLPSHVEFTLSPLSSCLACILLRSHEVLLSVMMACRKKKLPSWWGPKEDADLLRGAHIHGHKDFRKIRSGT